MSSRISTIINPRLKQKVNLSSSTLQQKLYPTLNSQTKIPTASYVTKVKPRENPIISTLPIMNPSKLKEELAKDSIQTVGPPKIPDNVTIIESSTGGNSRQVSTPIPKASTSNVESVSANPSTETNDRAVTEISKTEISPYKDTPLTTLLNSYMVFQLCRIPNLAKIGGVGINALERVGLGMLTSAVVKRTFFKHFCGGEDLTEVIPTMSALQSQGIGSILDLSMESDLSHTTYSSQHYLSEAVKIRELMQQSILIAKTQPDSFIAAKITAFVPPVMLQEYTTFLKKVEDYCRVSVKNGSVSKPDFVEIVAGLGASPMAQKAAEKFYGENVKDQKFTPETLKSIFSLFNTRSRDLVSQIVPMDVKLFDDIMEQVRMLVAFASDNGVRIMVDAEQTYFQAAIDEITLQLCEKFNPKLENPPRGNISDGVGKLSGPVVFNTYQMYLVDSLDRLKRDAEKAERDGYSFGIKLVRGAYMVSERKRAQEMGYSDPVNPTLDKTHEKYNAAIEYLVSKVAATSATPSAVTPISFVVASHNYESIKHTQRLISALPKTNVPIAFAQLLGMKDNITFELAGAGLKCYKYVPYGPVGVTIPYLLRRAQENSAVLGGGEEDRKGIVKELSRRFFG
ncbi:hypothetical protein HK098_004626 [Nowakowskiella sp. JEL0407]|nr:hypothetical protein HK098_004626 [Nowakowskiella sp. JEL0407]